MRILYYYKSDKCMKLPHRFEGDLGLMRSEAKVHMVTDSLETNRDKE